MHTILINGPAGAGKNTLAKALRNPLFERAHANDLSVRSVGIEEFKSPLIHMLFAFAASLSEIGLDYDPMDEEEYLRLKNHVMLGKTGRQWQIIWADAMRASYQQVFIDSLYTKVRNMNLDIAIVPDCGFPDEYQILVERLGKHNVTLVYLDHWRLDVPVYRHMDTFENDIRRCLRDWADLVNPNVSIVAPYVIGRILNESNAQLKLSV